MTDLLDKAIAELKRLPEREQDDIARDVLDLLASERRWDALFEDPRSESLLSRMAAKARAEVAAGRELDGDPSDSDGP